MGCNASSPAGASFTSIPTVNGDMTSNNEEENLPTANAEIHSSITISPMMKTKDAELCEKQGSGFNTCHRSVLSDMLPINCQGQMKNSPERRSCSCNMPPDFSVNAAQQLKNAFSKRKWLVLPEHWAMSQYDLKSLHPPLPPYLGNTFWVPEGSNLLPEASTLAELSEQKENRWVDSDDSTHHSTIRFGEQSPEVLLQCNGSLTKRRAERLLLTLNSIESEETRNVPGTGEKMHPSTSDEQLDSLNSTMDDDDENFINAYSPTKSVNTSAELLDYSSFLEESYSQDQREKVQAILCGKSLTPTPTPRRLFSELKLDELDTTAEETTFEHDEEEGLEQEYSPRLPSPKTPNQPTHHRNTDLSPSVSTFHGHWGTRHERHISTLPSQTEPIRLRVIECSGRPSLQIGQGPPYCSVGRFIIRTQNGKPYGHGLEMKATGPFMTLENSLGDVLAVVKSQYTHVPSVIVYGPRPRYASQVEIVDASVANISQLFTWALITKGGQTMEDDCSCFLVDQKLDDCAISNDSSRMFNSSPTFRGWHCSDGFPHTVVSRCCQTTLNEKPCCVSVRDPNDVDSVDVSIAPGIDPLLMICYLASYYKMDLEPSLLHTV